MHSIDHWSEPEQLKYWLECFAKGRLRFLQKAQSYMFDWDLNNFWQFYINLPRKWIRLCIALLQYHVTLSYNLKQSLQLLSENDIGCIGLVKKIYSVNVLLEKVTSMEIKNFTKNDNGAFVVRVSRVLVFFCLSWLVSSLA